MASRLLVLLLSASLADAAGAAELGEPLVSSHVGQPLVADIELNLVEDPAAPVQVRLAHPNVYRAANIDLPPVLSTIDLSVMQRDGRQVLHITSRAPVESRHLHLYLELRDGAQRTVRLATLWLTPDPNPAPPSRAASAPEPAATVAPPAPPSPPRLAAKPAAKPSPQTTPRPKAPRATPVAAALPPDRGTCAPADLSAQVKACVALDYKNAELREQIGKLEDKVKVLQVAMGADPAAVATPVTPATGATKVHKPRKKRAPEPEDETPWAWIGAGLAAMLALLGGLFVLKRRKQATRLRVPAAPAMPLMARLRQRFARRKPAPDVVEPGKEEVTHDTSTQV